MIENKKKPNPIDVHVGSRIRLRRNMLGLSQEKLGESLGITFQQIQKYEKGTNRVSASKLWLIARFLNVELAYFFEGLSDSDVVAEPQQDTSPAPSPTRQSMEVNSLVPRLKLPQQKLVLELVRSMSANPQTGA